MGRVLLLVGSTAWALRGLLEPRWAFFATFLLVLAVGIAGDWAQSYWGGAVAAAGGALVFGATLRLVNGEARWSDGIVGGIGLALLVNSRPLEGLLLAAGTGVWILFSFATRRDYALRGRSAVHWRFYRQAAV